MDFTINLDIVSQETEVLSSKGEYIYIPGEMGEMCAVFGHAQLLSFLRPGLVRVVSSGKEEVFYVHGGFAEIQPDKVTILADVVARAKDLDEAEITEAKRKAQEKLSTGGTDLDYAAAMADLAQAIAQLQAISRHKRKHH